MNKRIETVALAIQAHEGYVKAGSYAYNPLGSPSYRNKNPGNIVWGPLARSFGAKTFWTHPLTKHDFAIFPTYEQGFAALCKLVEDAASGKSELYRPNWTILEFFTKYSPIRNSKGQVIPNEPYAKDVAHRLNMKITDQIGQWIDQAPEEAPSAPKLIIENQLDTRKWGKWYLGKVKTSSFEKFGCYLFCWSYLLSVKQGKTVLPSDVDKIFVKEGVYNGDLIDSVKAAKVLGMAYLGKEKNINKAPDYFPTIKEVDFSIAGGAQQHFVVRTKVNGKNVILDPYGGVQREINYYEKKTNAPNWENGHFSYRLIKI